jgi:hypothetical protein
VIREVGSAILDAVGEAVRREAAEDDRVDGADPRAGEHRVGRLGDHRQVDRDPVALLDPALLEHVCKPVDLLAKLSIGDFFILVGAVALPQDRGLIPPCRQMPVDAVHRHVEGAVMKPTDMQIAGVVGDVLHLGEGLDPVDAPSVLAPEGLRIAHRRLVHRLVLGGVDPRPRGMILGDRKQVPLRHGVHSREMASIEALRP